MKVLIVEDEERIREVEKAYLERAGYSVTEAGDGIKAAEILSHQTFDAIVLDLNLPGKDGIEICKLIRDKDRNVPILMVTARVEEIDEIRGLEIGADDYIKKPFSPNVLTARVQALLRRTAPDTLEFGDLTIDSEKMKVLKKGIEKALTTTQFNILVLLASKPGKVFNREEIIEKAYEGSIPPDVLDRTIDAHIKSIRKAIETNTRKPKYVKTIVGKGYTFEAKP